MPKISTKSWCISPATSTSSPSLKGLRHTHPFTDFPPNENSTKSASSSTLVTFAAVATVAPPKPTRAAATLPQRSRPFYFDQRRRTRNWRPPDVAYILGFFRITWLIRDRHCRRFFRSYSYRTRRMAVLGEHEVRMSPRPGLCNGPDDLLGRAELC